MCIFLKGDIHGWTRFSSISSRHHIGPSHNDYGSSIVFRSRVLDYVGPRMAKSGDISDICIIQLSACKSERKEER